MSVDELAISLNDRYQNILDTEASHAVIDVLVKYYGNPDTADLLERTLRAGDEYYNNVYGTFNPDNQQSIHE